MTNLLRLLCTLAAFAVVPVDAALQTAQKNTAGTVTPQGGWTNPNNAASQNFQCALGDGTSAAAIMLTNWGFTIPAGSTILDVAVNARASFNDVSTQDQIWLVKGGVAVGNPKVLNGPGSVSVPSCTSGGFIGGISGLSVGGDLWGTTLTVAEVNSSGFGVLYDNSFSNTAVDGVVILVHYQDNVTITVTPSAGAHGTISPNTPQTVVTGETTQFTIVPDYGYAAVVGGTCGGQLVGYTYSTPSLYTSCTVDAQFAFLPDVVSDFNGDAKSDILYRNFANGQVYRLLMNGLTVTSGAMAYNEPDLNWRIVSDADFNNDGVQDLLWRNLPTGQVIFMPFNMSGMPAGGISSVYTEPNPAWKIVHTPDIDGDSIPDIVWWNSSTGQVYVMLMNSGATVRVQGLMYSEPNTAWKIVAAGDFAGTGKENQLLWRNSATGQVYLMTVSYTFPPATFSQTGTMVYTEPNLAWKIVGAADFNADGKADILWRNDQTGEIYIMLMNGASIASRGLMYTEANLAWKIVALGDYNGDGKADVLWRNDQTGQLYMLLMDGLAIASRGTVYNEPNLNWRVLGPTEYGLASGIFP